MEMGIYLQESREPEIKATPKCEWKTEVGEYEGVYITSCINEFWLSAGTPKDNGMKFCCYCGKRIKEVIK